MVATRRQQEVKVKNVSVAKKSMPLSKKEAQRTVKKLNAPRSGNVTVASKAKLAVPDNSKVPGRLSRKATPSSSNESVAPRTRSRRKLVEEVKKNEASTTSSPEPKRLKEMPKGKNLAISQLKSSVKKSGSDNRVNEHPQKEKSMGVNLKDAEIKSSLKKGESRNRNVSTKDVVSKEKSKENNLKDAKLESSVKKSDSVNRNIATSNLLPKETSKENNLKDAKLKSSVKKSDSVNRNIATSNLLSEETSKENNQNDVTIESSAKKSDSLNRDVSQIELAPNERFSADNFSQLCVHLGKIKDMSEEVFHSLLDKEITNFMFILKTYETIKGDQKCYEKAFSALASLINTSNKTLENSTQTENITMTDFAHSPITCRYETNNCETDYGIPTYDKSSIVHGGEQFANCLENLESPKMDINKSTNITLPIVAYQKEKEEMLPIKKQKEDNLLNSSLSDQTRNESFPEVEFAAKIETDEVEKIPNLCDKENVPSEQDSIVMEDNHCGELISENRSQACQISNQEDVPEVDVRKSGELISQNQPESCEILQSPISSDVNMGKSQELIFENRSQACPISNHVPEVDVKECGEVISQNQPESCEILQSPTVSDVNMENSDELISENLSPADEIAHQSDISEANVNKCGELISEIETHACQIIEPLNVSEVSQEKCEQLVSENLFPDSQIIEKEKNPEADLEMYRELASQNQLDDSQIGEHEEIPGADLNKCDEVTYDNLPQTCQIADHVDIPETNLEKSGEIELQGHQTVEQKDVGKVLEISSSLLDRTMPTLNESCDANCTMGSTVSSVTVNYLNFTDMTASECLDNSQISDSCNVQPPDLSYLNERLSSVIPCSFVVESIDSMIDDSNILNSSEISENSSCHVTHNGNVSTTESINEELINTAVPPCSASVADSSCDYLETQQELSIQEQNESIVMDDSYQSFESGNNRESISSVSTGYVDSFNQIEQCGAEPNSSSILILNETNPEKKLQCQISNAIDESVICLGGSEMVASGENAME